MRITIVSGARPNFLKIRASWGQVGNANIDAFQYLAPIKSTNTHYLFGSGYGDSDAAAQLGTNWGAYPSRLANADIKWETSQQTNIGLDARFLNSRLGVNFEFLLLPEQVLLILMAVE